MRSFMQVMLRPLFVLTTLVSLTAGRVSFRGRSLTRSSDVLSSYDYIVVGGGTSGLVVANQLSENPTTTVLIIEAGKFDQNEDFITIPILSTGNIPVLGNGARGTQYDWNMSSVLQPQLLNRSIATPAGKVIGGGTVLNGMVFNRGSKADYDRWEELGNPEWTFDNLLPYFKKAEHFTPPEKQLAEEWDIEYVPEYHGEDGDVQCSFPNFVWPSTRNFMKSMEELNVPILKDAMGGNATAAYWFLLALDPEDESRSTSQTFYIPSRPNLHLLTENQVIKLVVDTDGSEPKVSGVEYSAGKSAPTYQVSVKKEVVLAAGALHTPQILEVSGIGDSRILSRLGIPTMVDLPGVGANYQDHLLLVTAQTVDISVQTGNFSNATWNAEQRALYDTKREGPYTTAGGNFFAFLPLSTFTNSSTLHSLSNVAASQSPSTYLPPDTHPSVLAGYTAQHEILTRSLNSPDSTSLEFIFDDSVIIPSLQQPFSRGTVHINSTSPFLPPVINSRYLSNPLDVSTLISGFLYSRTIRTTQALQDISAMEVYPGASVSSEDESQIENFVRGGVDTENHHAGTAAMLPRELGGVVDSELRVYGVEGLRIVDASCMPMIPAAHLQDTVYAIAEMASDYILAGGQAGRL